MSVVIEAVCVVVPTKTLDVTYPGGADQFLLDSLPPRWDPRYALRDPYLACLSFYSGDLAWTMVVHLIEHANLIGIDQNAWQDLAIIEQGRGPTMPATWLDWRDHPDGFTVAWLATDPAPDEMIAPSDWTAERSRNLTRGDVRDDPDMLKLAEEDGLQFWIDLRTGEQSAGLADGYAPDRRIRSEGDE